MICDFTTFSIVFQSYLDDGRVILKGCVQWNPIYGWRDFQVGLKPWTAKSAGQGLSTELQGLLLAAFKVHR